MFLRYRFQRWFFSFFGRSFHRGGPGARVQRIGKDQGSPEMAMASYMFDFMFARKLRRCESQQVRNRQQRTPTTTENLRQQSEAAIRDCRRPADRIDHASRHSADGYSKRGRSRSGRRNRRPGVGTERRHDLRIPEVTRDGVERSTACTDARRARDIRLSIEHVGERRKGTNLVGDGSQRENAANSVGATKRDHSWAARLAC